MAAKEKRGQHIFVGIVSACILLSFSWVLIIPVLNKVMLFVYLIIAPVIIGWFGGRSAEQPDKQAVLRGMTASLIASLGTLTAVIALEVVVLFFIGYLGTFGYFASMDSELYLENSIPALKKTILLACLIDIGVVIVYAGLGALGGFLTRIRQKRPLETSSAQV